MKLKKIPKDNSPKTGVLGLVLEDIEKLKIPLNHLIEEHNKKHKKR